MFESGPLALVKLTHNAVLKQYRHIQDADKQIDQLYAALHEYGQHHDYCIYHTTDDIDSCDCGFHEAWEAN